MPSKIKIDVALLKPLPWTAHRRSLWRNKFRSAPDKPLPKKKKVKTDV